MPSHFTHLTSTTHSTDTSQHPGSLSLPSYVLEFTLVLFHQQERSTGFLRELTLAAVVPVVNTLSLSHALQLPVDSHAGPLQKVLDVTLLSKVRTTLSYPRCTTITGCSFEIEQCIHFCLNFK